jgi:hypothetical protein
MEFAQILRVGGERVRFEPGARVFGEMVSRGGSGAASQRQRWEVGRRSLRGKFARPLAGSPSLAFFRKSCYLLDLFFPPLVTLALGLVAVSSVHLMAAFDGRFAPGSHLLFPVHAAMFGIFVVYAVSPTLILALPVRYLISLLALPYYMAWKLIIATGRGPKAWVRTPREPQTPT